LNMLTLSKLLVAAAIVAAVLTPVNASPSKVKREDECQAKCSTYYAENGGDIKLDLCEAGCGGEDATRDVLVGKLQDSINTLANRDDKTEYNAAVLELNSLCSDYDICSEWECFRDGVAKGEAPGIADLGDFAASTGLFKSCADCTGKWNGAVEDCEGTCEGTAVEDCAGVCKGTAVYDCAETCQGTAVEDCAGVCNGTAAQDCAGACEGTAVEDCAGACEGTAVEDCAGTCQGDAVADVCKVCGGNSTEISACPTVTTTITTKVMTQQELDFNVTSAALPTAVSLITFFVAAAAQL